MSNIKKQFTMNYFDPAENSNKVWIGIAFDNGIFEARFGRVREGANLAVKQKQFSSKASAIAELERKHHEKLRKGYRDTSVLSGAAPLPVVETVRLMTARIWQTQRGTIGQTTAEGFIQEKLIPQAARDLLQQFIKREFEI